jgi:hypothetical protein
MHYLSAKVTLDFLLTSPAAREAGSRGDTRESFEIDKPTSIPQDVFDPSAGNPSAFFMATCFPAVTIKIGLQPLIKGH